MVFTFLKGCKKQKERKKIYAAETACSLRIVYKVYFLSGLLLKKCTKPIFSFSLNQPVPGLPVVRPGSEPYNWVLFLL